MWRKGLHTHGITIIIFLFLLICISNILFFMIFTVRKMFPMHKDFCITLYKRFNVSRHPPWFYAATMKQRNKGGGDTMYKANLQRCRSVTLCISRLVSRFFVPASFICTQCTLFELYGFCDFLCLSPSHSHTTHSTFMFIPAFLFLHNKRISIAIRHFVSPIVWEIIGYKIVAPRRPSYVTLPPSLLFPPWKGFAILCKKNK